MIGSPKPTSYESLMPSLVNPLSSTHPIPSTRPRIGELIADPGRLADALGAYVETAGDQQQILMRAGEVAASWPELPVTQSRPAVAMLCRCITIQSERIDIEISGRGLYAFLRDEPTETSAAALQHDHPLLLSFPI